MSEEENSFKVVDRRREGRDESADDVPQEPNEPAKAEQPEPKSEPTDNPSETPQEAPADAFSGEQGFLHFIMSLATSAYMHLGMAPGPDGQPTEKNLPLAQQTIDILGMLEAKTQGNRSQQEDALFSQILSELRMNFVEQKK